MRLSQGVDLLWNFFKAGILKLVSCPHSMRAFSSGVNVWQGCRIRYRYHMCLLASSTAHSFRRLRENRSASNLKLCRRSGNEFSPLDDSPSAISSSQIQRLSTSPNAIYLETTILGSRPGDGQNSWNQVITHNANPWINPHMGVGSRNGQSSRS